MKLFLDTNVLVDLYQERHPYYEDVKKLQIMEEFGDAELWVSAKSFTDIYYVMRRGGCANADILRGFEASFEFLNICSIDGEDVRNAARLKWLDFEDCLIEMAARKVKADFLLTRDASGFAQSKIPVKKPHAFLNWVEQECGLVYGDIDWWTDEEASPERTDV